MIDEVFLAAARTLADLVTEADMSHGAIFPALSRIREVSLAIATAVAGVAYHEGLATVPLPPDLSAFLKAQMYDPDYERSA